MRKTLILNSIIMVLLIISVSASTTIKLQIPGENLADIYAFTTPPDYNESFQVKWNISSVPVGQVIENAIQYLWITAHNGHAANVTVSRINNQSWIGESISAGDYNNMTAQKTNVTVTNFTGIWQDANWVWINITDIIKTDYDLANDYSTVRMESPFNPTDSDVAVITDNDALLFGQDATAIWFEDREGSYDGTAYSTFLNITFSEAPPPPDTCTSPGSGDWTVDASDECDWTEAQDVPEDIYIMGTGEVKLSSTFTFTGSNQYIYINKSAGLAIASGGSFA